MGAEGDLAALTERVTEQRTAALARIARGCIVECRSPLESWANQDND
jgi:hypothetical protein